MDKELLQRFLEGSISRYEEDQLKKWIEISEDNYRTFLQERKMYDALLLAAPNLLNNQKRNKRISPWVISTAAAILLLLIISGFYLFNLKSSTERYNTIHVPPGQRINIILADKSSVWLNANTKFRYPTTFSKKNRTVFLDGEAYFDVSKNKKRPFIVKTTQGDIRVTGTTFNLEAYSYFNTFETSLFEGGVEIYKNGKKLVFLKPNEKAVLINNKMVVSKITDTDEYMWRNNLIIFNNKCLEEILLSFEKYFNVKIQIDSKKIPNYTYTGKFRISDGLDYALRVLQRNIQFTYERNEKTGIINIKQY